MAEQRTRRGHAEGMGRYVAPAPFVQALRATLRLLYDPVSLRQSRLIALLGLSSAKDAPVRLRSLLIEAIESFKPAPDVPPQANAWRTHRILYERFVEQFSQQEVATHCAVGTRQLRRQEAHAVHALADWLWTHYGPSAKDGQVKPSPYSTAAEPGSAGEETPSLEQEMAWLRASYPDETVDVAQTLREALKVVAPILRALDVRLACAVSEGLPPVTAHLTTLRHALSNVLTAAIRRGTHGQMRIAVQAHAVDVCLHVQSEGPLPIRMALDSDDRDNLSMAQRLLEFSRGSLTVLPSNSDTSPFVADLRLPAASQWTVLVIDDNPDTLRLVERHLSATPYRFTGLSDPALAVAAAEEASPDAILLDVMLPGIDGWQLVGRLREHPKLGSVPIIVCTILAQEQLALALGAAGFLRKPVSRLALLRMLDQVVDRRRKESD